ETEARGHCYAPHAACPRDLAKGEGVHYGIDGSEMGVVENVAGGQTQVQGPGFPDGNGLVYGHVEGDLPRPFDDVAPSVSEGRACGVRTSGTEIGRASCRESVEGREGE